VECDKCDGMGILCDSCGVSVGGVYRSCEACEKDFCATVTHTCECAGRIGGHPSDAQGRCIYPPRTFGADHFSGHDCAPPALSDREGK
jgi:hypothetical protein